MLNSRSEQEWAQCCTDAPGGCNSTETTRSISVRAKECERQRTFGDGQDAVARSVNDCEGGVASDPNALGYFGYAYYQANQDQVKAVAIDSVPSPQSVAEGNQPLSRPLLIYVAGKAARRPEVNAFTPFYLSPDSTKYVKKVGYVPLPTAALITQTTRFASGRSGSALGGVKLSAFDEDERQMDRIETSWCSSAPDRTVS